MGSRGEPFPPSLEQWSGDYIVSYLSPWIIPEPLLDRARRASINFHPGPPEYPGIGCTNFAIYDGVDSFGITCHHMNPKVDTGKLIAVRRFPLYETDTVLSLTQRCYEQLLLAFHEIAPLLVAGEELPELEEHWTRKPYRRQELDDLCRITPGMSEAEIRRRVRAVTFPDMPGAYIELAGHRFHCER